MFEGLKKNKILTAFLVVGFALMALSAEAGTKVTGTLYSLNAVNNTLTLKSGGILSTINLSPKTKFSRNGAASTLKGLVLGDHLTLVYRSSLFPSRVTAKGASVKTVAGKVQGVSPTGVVTVGSAKVKTSSHTRIIRNGAVAWLGTIAKSDSVIVHVADSTGEADDVDADGPEEAEVSGVVSAVDTTLNTVSITPSGGGPDVTVNVTADTFIEVNGADATISDIQVGMNASAEYDPTTMNAFGIEADSESEDAEIEGTITAIDLVNGTVTITDSSNNTVTVGVDSGTQIERDGEPAFLSDLQVNDSASVEYDVSTMIASDIEASSGI